MKKDFMLRVRMSKKQLSILDSVLKLHPEFGRTRSEVVRTLLKTLVADFLTDLPKEEAEIIRKEEERRRKINEKVIREVKEAEQENDKQIFSEEKA